MFDMETTMTCPSHLKFLREVHKVSITTGYIRNFRKNNPGISWTEVLYPVIGDSILHICARLNNVNVLKYVLNDWPPNHVDFTNKDSKTALHEAAQFCCVESVKLLIESGANVNALKRSDWTPLMLACTKSGAEAYEIVRCLLENGASADIANKDGWLALHLACRSGDVDTVEELLKYEDVSRKVTANGKTAMHVAALHGNTEVVKFLIENTRISVNAKDKSGNSILHDAVCSDNTILVDLLIAKGAISLSVNDVGLNCLHLAAAQGLQNMVSYLITYIGIDPNCKTEKGVTPLHCAARNKKINVMDQLASLGGDSAVKDAHGRFPEDYLML